MPLPQVAGRLNERADQIDVSALVIDIKCTICTPFLQLSSPHLSKPRKTITPSCTTAHLTPLNNLAITRGKSLVRYRTATLDRSSVLDLAIADTRAVISALESQSPSSSSSSSSVCEMEEMAEGDCIAWFAGLKFVVRGPIPLRERRLLFIWKAQMVRVAR
jgi:hypothetical protein